MNSVSINHRLKRNYDGYYNSESTNWRYVGAFDKVENIQDLCNGIPHNTVLEIGAGEGAVLARLAERQFAESYYALEVSESGLSGTRERNIPGLIEANVYDGYNTPYADNQFDLAILSHVIEHVEHPRLLLAEAARIADYVFVEVPLEDRLGLPMDFQFKRLGHINFYTYKSVRRLLQSCGLQVLRQETTNPALATYQFRYGKVKGAAKHAIKEAAMRLFPRLASKCLTFHCPILATRAA